MERFTKKRRGVYDIERTDTPFTCYYAPSSLIEAFQFLGHLEDILDAYGIKDLQDLQTRLEQHAFFTKPENCCISTREYNDMLRELNEYFKTERELGCNLIGFIRTFMQGDAMWAFHPEKRIIGEIKMKDPFSQQITIKRIVKEPLVEDYDKKKLN